jgi:hypothetical protein
MMDKTGGKPKYDTPTVTKVNTMSVLNTVKYTDNGVTCGSECECPISNLLDGQKVFGWGNWIATQFPFTIIFELLY